MTLCLESSLIHNHHYCDFVVWTPKGLYIECIVEDKSFFEEVKPYLDNYFLGVLLPVLLTGRIETVLPETTSNQTSSNTASSCKCGKPEKGCMITCSNDKCPIRYFHYKCIGIPKGQWFCSDNCKNN